jgi:hypothetical protein
MWDDDIPIHPIPGQDETNSTNRHIDETSVDDLMHDESITDRFHRGIYLKNITVSNFIQQKFISGDGTNIFEHVYAPILGTREVLVRRHHVPEALNLIAVIHVELCRIMNHKSIIQTYDNYDEILKQTTTSEPWLPFDIQAEICSAPGNTNNYPSFIQRSKRSRANENRNDQYKERLYQHQNDSFSQQNTSHHSSTPHSYCSIATATTNTSNVTDNSTYDLTTTNTPTTDTTDIVSSLRHEVRTLTESIQKIDTKVNDSNIATTSAIQSLEISQTARMNDMERTHNNQIQELDDNFLHQLQTSQCDIHKKLASLFEC